jgi:hypothetical protein
MNFNITNMKNKILFIALISILFQFCSTKQLQFNYEFSCNDIGTQGTKVIKVFTTGRNAETAMKSSNMMAVHAFLFKTVVCDGQPQPAISKYSYNEKKDFFDDFFISGKYQDYVMQTSNATIKSEDRRRLENGDIKVGVKVQVQYKALHQYMISKGMANSLTNSLGM